MKFIYSIILLFLTFFSFSQVKNNSQIQTKLISELPGDPTVPTDPLDPIELDPVDPVIPTTLSPSLGSGEVGSTRGELSVSKTGGAVYSIPIDLPPGVNNIAPSVSLNYSSQSGDGYAGYGWNIGGISKIVRIPSTIYHDGIVDSVDGDELDRFALDGQRLILKTGIYGQVGSTYETENYSNLKISYLTHGWGYNTYFKVEYPNGNVAYYGYIENGDTELSFVEWPITKWESPQNLKITYEYYPPGFLDEWGTLIKSVKYGNDTDEGINKIEFFYKDKNRQDVYYVWGAERKRNKILSSIKITGKEAPYRNYYLTHDLTSTGYERLIQIQETTGDDTKSLKPIIFDYNKDQNSFVQEINYSHRGERLSNSSYFPTTYLFPGDYTGNGDIEIKSVYNYISKVNEDYTVSKYYNVTGYGAWNILNNNLELSNRQNSVSYSSNSDGTKKVKVYSYDNTSSQSVFEYEKNFTSILDDFVLYTSTMKCSEGQKGQYVLYGDYNGDNLTDVLLINLENGVAETQFINLDRRIMSDFSFNSGSINVGTISNCISDGEADGATVIKQGDYNGDGKMDLYVFRGYPFNKIEIYSLVDNTFVTIGTFSYNFNVNLLKQNQFPIVLGDFNGDGKSDVLFAWEKKILYSKSTTSLNGGFVVESLPSTFKVPAWPYYEMYLALDIDNDGKSDITRLNPVKIDAPFPRHGIEIDFYDKNNNWQNSTITQMFYTSINGDTGTYTYDPDNYNSFFETMIPLFVREKKQGLVNKAELAILGGEGISYFIFNRHADEQGLLKNIANNGIMEDIFYDSLENENGVYTSGTNLEKYPYYNLLNGKKTKVVSEIRERFSGYFKKKLYKYYGAIFDFSGRGFNGFQATTTTNWFTQSSDIISTVNKYDFNKNGANTEIFSMPGLIEPNYVLQSADPYIARTINTYNHEDTAYVNPLLSNKVFKLFKTKTESFNGLTGTSSVTTVNYNSYNNPVNSTTTVKNGTTVEKISTNNFNYDSAILSPYIIDRLNSKISTTTIYPSGDVHTSEEQYVYDINLLKEIKKRTTNSGLTSDFITENNEYDTYGNLIQKKYSAPGMTDRIANYEYDDQTHRFIVKKTDAELQETLYEYDQNTGVLLSETAPSNTSFPLKTTYTYDKWGKVIRITDYLGKLSTITYENLSNNLGVLKTISNSDRSSTKTIIDPLGRVLHEGYKTIENKWSVKSTQYNIYDQPILTTGNYFDGDMSEVWNEMQYDIYGRIIQSNHLKTLSSQGKVTMYNYNGLTTVENDGLKTKTTIKNAVGQVVSLEDSPGEIVTYEYFANGNLKKALTSASTIEIQQDAFGRKRTLIDPSAGTRKYEYNKFGELIKEEVVGKGFTEFDLDANGKLLEKNITEAGTLKSKATYNYNGNKQLSGIVFNDYANSSTINYTYNYDNYKRLIFKEEIGNQFYFEQEITYDGFGRPEKQFYSAKNLSDNKISNKWIKTEYKNGFSWKMYDMQTPFASGVLLWETKEVNASGDILSAGLNDDDLLLNKSFDMYGFPTQIKYSNNLSDYMIQNTVFDPIYGNLTQRTSNLFGTTWTENLSYDQLDRLTTWKDNEGVQNQTYNGNGTIDNNKIGSYAYTISNKPFQVSTITPQYPSAVYDYYANREQNISYDINKKPVSITELNAENIDFEYNPMDSRSIMYYGDLESAKTDRIYRKYYSADGSMEIKRNLNTNQVEFITYVQGSPYSSSVVLKSDGTNQEYLYLLKDYQGTINGIVNASGNVIEKRQFDVWGALINFANAGGITSVPTTANSLVLDRGYTSHEHLLGVNIINMNGRIYDYNLHKFLQPDNNIQDFYNTQNYNRYSYVMNNPTKYTDENGEFWQYIVGALFNAYASGYQSSGDFNPLHWNSTAWANAGMGAASFGASTAATYYADNYISNYGNNNIDYDEANSYDSMDNQNYVVVNSEGIVVDVNSSGGNNRFFDENGIEMFFNDPDNDFSEINDWGIGDRLYYPISSKELADAVYGTGGIGPLTYRTQGKLAEAWALAALESYGGADFTMSYLVPNYFTNDQFRCLEEGIFRMEYNSYNHFFRFGNSKSVYNLYDAGNFMWGNWMGVNGFSINSLEAGSNINSILFSQSIDSGADQRAIRNGFYFYKY